MMYKIYYMDRHHNPVNYTFVKANSLEEAYIKAKDSEPFLPTKHNFKYESHAVSSMALDLYTYNQIFIFLQK